MAGIAPAIDCGKLDADVKRRNGETRTRFNHREPVRDLGLALSATWATEQRLLCGEVTRHAFPCHLGLQTGKCRLNELLVSFKEPPRATRAGPIAHAKNPAIFVV